MTILTNLMPPAFSQDTLDLFSTTTGRPGTPSWASLNSAVTNDVQLGPALVVPASSAHNVMYMAETPIVPGRYLQVSAQIRLPSPATGFQARIRAFPMKADGNAASVDTVGALVTIETNEVVTVSAVIGTGHREGVDLVWTPDVASAHLGIEIVSDGSFADVNLGQIRIEDVSAAYVADSAATIDVRDFGAVADTSINSLPAFLAADAAAQGRTILVPPGVYLLDGDMAFENPVEFQGTVSMNANNPLLLKKNFNLASYASAFGSDEEGFKRALAAMLTGVGHKDLDLNGRVIRLTAPVEIGNYTDVSQISRRYRLQNATFELANKNDPVWDPEQITVSADYDQATAALTNISNIDQIKVGMLVEGAGVGREVYVKSIDQLGKRALLNLPLYGNPGIQTYTLTRFKYMLDFAGIKKMELFEIDNVEFTCANTASAIMLPAEGSVWRISQCYFAGVGQRAITSPGEADQGILVDNCNFSQNSNFGIEQRGVAINSAKNDIKLRHNRAAFFKHFAVIAGQNALVLGNHVFQGEASTRTAGFVLTAKSMRAMVCDNYIDNCNVEIINEHDADPTTGFPIGSLTLSANNFRVSDANQDFNFIRFKPLGSFKLEGVSVCDNVFAADPATKKINRVEGIDSTVANFSGFSRIKFTGNAYTNVIAHTQNPRPLEHSQNTAQSTWTVNFGDSLPFAQGPSHVDSIVAAGRINDTGSGFVWSMPQVDFGGAASEMRLYWQAAARGSVVVTARMDDADG